MHWLHQRCFEHLLWISNAIFRSKAEMEIRLTIKLDIFVIVSICPEISEDQLHLPSVKLSKRLSNPSPSEDTCYAKVVIVKGNLKYIPTNWQQHKRGNWKMTEDMLRPKPLLKFVEMFSHIKGKQSIRSLMMKELPKSPVDWRSLRCMTPLNLSWRSYLYSAAIRSVRRDQMSRLN